MENQEKEQIYTELNTILELVEDLPSSNQDLIIEKIEDLMNKIQFYKIYG